MPIMKTIIITLTPNEHQETDVNIISDQNPVRTIIIEQIPEGNHPDGDSIKIDDKYFDIVSIGYSQPQKDFDDTVASIVKGHYGEILEWLEQQKERMLDEVVDKKEKLEDINNRITAIKMKLTQTSIDIKS